MLLQASPRERVLRNAAGPPPSNTLRTCVRFDGSPRPERATAAPPPQNTRHPRRDPALPLLPPEAARLLRALRGARRGRARDPRLEARAPPDAAAAVDGDPGPVRAQEVAGELRAADAQARDQGVGREPGGGRHARAVPREAPRGGRRSAHGEVDARAGRGRAEDVGDGDESVTDGPGAEGGEGEGVG